MTTILQSICRHCRTVQSRLSPGIPLRRSPCRYSTSITRPGHEQRLGVGPKRLGHDRLGQSLPSLIQDAHLRQLATQASRHAQPARRARRWLRRLLGLSLLSAGAAIADVYTYDSCLTRTLRTFTAGLTTALDYKINFRPNPPFAKSLQEVHTRNARRLFELLSANGGLYIKLGQALAMQSAVLPPEFQRMFATLFDDAPHNTWDEVRQVIREDFGKEVDALFGPGRMQHEPRASASVAQVHWARLEDGREVAIKVQKREIARQIGWDLWAFKVVTNIYSYWFDLPFNTLVPYISERLMLETDFETEVRNAETMRRLVSEESRLRGRVYIPKVYKDFCSRRIMTAEWIEGASLWDKQAITEPWRGGWREGSPGAGGAMLDFPAPSTSAGIAPAAASTISEKPDRDAWRQAGGLGLSYKPIMEAMVSLFSAQMFLWGHVHADPHPGNIFIRRLPSGEPELVLIDHGLYIALSPQFRHQYARFWKALMLFDNKTIAEITSEWGINNPDLFASATLMRPYTGGDNTTSKGITSLSTTDVSRRSYEMQMKMRKGIRAILGDGSKFPQELIFLGRNLRIVQGNNQHLGSPVNRIKITGNWASRALTEDRSLDSTQRWKYYASHLAFQTVLLATDLVFWFSKLRQLVGLGRGMDDDIEQSMVKMAKGFGIDMQHGVFEG